MNRNMNKEKNERKNRFLRFTAKYVQMNWTNEFRLLFDRMALIDSHWYFGGKIEMRQIDTK